MGKYTPLTPPVPHEGVQMFPLQSVLVIEGGALSYPVPMFS